MNNILRRIGSSIQKEGIIATLAKMPGYPIRMIERTISIRSFKKTVLSLNNVEDRFTEIYMRNHWGNDESVSGSGSTRKYTEKLEGQIINMFDKLSIKSIFDGPCGDFNWMKHIISKYDINYIGGDIVAPLIDSLILENQNDKTKFIHINLIKDKFPEADLMMCRDCLFHLSYQDAKLVLENFVASNIPYLITTTHVNTTNFENHDIITGDFRLMDLFSAPYNLPKDVLYRIEDWMEPDTEREMCLWTRAQISDGLKNFAVGAV